MTELPQVSILIPCFNEREFIGTCLDSILANDYPQERLELLVIDGMSTDGTRAIVADYIRRFPVVRLVDNARKFKPHALNLGIREARGTVVIRMDAHTVYEPDYISKSVRYLDECQADNVGGIRTTRSRNDSVLAQAIAISISHPFAAGNASYRTGTKQRLWVDTVFGGCYRKDVFDRIGQFDEALIRGQDREFNLRLRRAGGRILLAPDIVCHYYARSDFKGFVEWTYVSGMTPFYISRITGHKIFSWRNLIPPLFVLAPLVLLSLAVVWSPVMWVFLSLAGLYLALCAFFSARIAWTRRDPRFLLAMPLVFAATHAVYGVGSLAGLFQRVERAGEWSKV